MQGVQIGGQITGAGAGGSATFNFESNDTAFQSMTGSLTVNQVCFPFGNVPSGTSTVISTLTSGQGTGAKGIAVPNPPPVLSVVSPTKAANVIISGVTALGSNFTSKSQVLLDGIALTTLFGDSGTLFASPTDIISQGIHFVSVTDSGATSSSLPLTVYVPTQGPQPFLSPSLITSGDVSSGSISIADVNGDGIPDLFVPGLIYSGTAGRVFWGRGDGTFAFAGSTSPSAFMIADLNGDGLAELIGSNGNQLLIWPGSGDPNFNVSPLTFSSFPLVGIPPVMMVADIDGDGHPDVIARGTIYFGRGNLQFDVIQAGFGDPLAIRDFDNDGKLDIFTGTQTVLNKGNRTFTSVDSRIGHYIFSPAVGDFNGDGILDLVTTDFGSGSGGILMINYGRGDGTFYLQGEIGTPDRIQSIAVGDFNRDGRLDIVTGFLTTSQIGVFTNDGQGGFQIAYAPSGGQNNQIIEADFNGDGKPDLADLTDYASTAWVVLGK